ncbi:3-ketosteroid-9-alpha-hydroxylase reductase subunit [Roseovarius sp. THAF27]|uniref:hybrid-cluster NAD(P)-dependent oxidoreductase n=1 Tax=Roseovarius sp. THAF27 TaxID=2587850 RepID=UPI0012692A36|nr:hybrid-cluster NAD(P)-dependent oxidoreductase [Roseovarius sp. THAF27]QFT80008.1 3-ketosteroid-9-alpha-hydroxylase reductase subunit [Roseovarius sp. THAF27]
MNDLSHVPARAIWSDDEMLECVSVIPERPNTATFTFRAPSGALFDYRPGQFLTLEIPAPGGTVHRTYTISSSPSRPRSVSVTVKAQADSVGTRWMLDNLVPGVRIRALGPSGLFTHLDHPAEKYLFISAGSGITPMMSMTTWMFDLGTEPDIVFINCARRPGEIIFRERLEHMSSRVPGIDLHWVVETPDRYAPWTGYRGTFNQLMLGLMAQDYLEREVFCCGPEPFMQAVREALQGLGFDMAHYHQESFHAPAATEAEIPEIDDVVPDQAAQAEVEFALSGVSANVSETDTILSAARANGLNIPSGCTFGVCGTCKVRKSAGEVHMVHNGGISEDDIAEGYILACCSHPIGKVSVDV